ncbi:lectin like domain-containing protein [Methanolobus sp. ZRKC5]|uniref:lectin like domain-containing protein n=1 Tax=unclassified Methanolobus TaxID=2629569 RepID=UPI00313BBD49
MKKLMLLNKLFLICGLVLILASIPANAAEFDVDVGFNSTGSNVGSQISVAPLNPAFVQYQEELKQSQNDVPASVDTNGSTNTFAPSSVILPDSSGENSHLNLLSSINLFEEDGFPNEFAHPTGLMPSPVDLSHLSPVNMDELLASEGSGFSPSSIMPTGLEVYPSRYDLRDNNGVTAVRDQGYAGSCWAHASIGSLESFLLHNQSDTWDISENNAKNILVSSNQDGFDRAHGDGGNNLITTAYFTRWDGPVVESDDPYNDLSGISPSNTTVAKHVQEVMILPGVNESNDLFKWMITNYGAISVSMWYDGSCFNSENNTYYYYDEIRGTNHAVTLVGWDDDFDRHNFTQTAPGNGAFIIKNSWGTNWGEDGYFYTSYYDNATGLDIGFYGLNTKPYGRNFMFTAENVSNYDHIYQHDPLGWTACTGYNNTTAYGANVFTATTNESLEAVSFYTVDSNSFYNISVYRDPETGPVNSSGPVSVQNGSIPIAGYHTVDLDTNVSLLQGQNFSVVVEFTTPNYNYPIAIEKTISGYSSNAHAEAGQSYMSQNGTEWEDISESDKNVCIKAFTKEEKVPKAAFVAGTKIVHINESVDFHDASLFSPTVWEWDFGDNNSSTLQNPVHTYANSGVYNVSLNATNFVGSNVSLKSSFIHVLNSTIIVNSSGSADFTSIREAINAASDGDTIMVEPGIYSENLYFADDNISLVSSTGNPVDVSVVSPDSDDSTIVIIADDIAITGINVSGGSRGIYISGSSGCNITNCYAADNFIGIYLSSSQNNSISNCTMDDNGYGLVVQRSNSNYFADNSLVNNIFDCVFDSEPNTVTTGNTINGKAIYYLVNSSDMTIDSASNAGLVHLINCSNITVQDVDITRNHYGFYLYNSSNITLTNCTSLVNAYGVYLSSSHNNTMYDCNISANIMYGLSLTGSSDNLFYNNYFNNSYSNVRVSGGAANEWNTAMTSGINIINGTYLGGNFWAQPDSTGWSQTQYSVGNGFCQPYEITDDGNNTDLLPLTSNGQQPELVESTARSDNDGVHVRIGASSVPSSKVAAMDSSIRYVGRGGEVQYAFTDKKTPVTDIRFEAETNEGYVMATVNLLDEPSEEMPASPTVKRYQSMDIVLGDERLSSSDCMEGAVIGFTVSKEWVLSNNIDKTSIRMEHYSGSVWDKLPTTVIGEDDENIYFESITTSFSPFVICADIIGTNINVGSPGTEIPSRDDYDVFSVTDENVQDTDKNGQGEKALILPFFGLVTVLGLIYWKK